MVAMAAWTNHQRDGNKSLVMFSSLSLGVGVGLTYYVTQRLAAAPPEQNWFPWLGPTLPFVHVSYETSPIIIYVLLQQSLW